MKEKITNIFSDDNGFLELEDKTAKDWHDMCDYYLSKIKNHEINNKHTVKLYAMRKRNYNTNREEYRKIWICDNCSEVFLKCKFDPELLKIKEFYQMCYDGGLSDIAELGVVEQVQRLTHLISNRIKEYEKIQDSL